MLGLYLLFLGVGGGLLALSLVGGLGDLPEDAAMAGDLEVGGRQPSDHLWVPLLSFRSWWLPLLSMRFWTYGAAFFGLTGVVVEGLGLAPPGVALPTAGAVAVGAGYAAAWIVQTLYRRQLSGEVEAIDYLGCRGEVVLRIDPGDPGQVRVEVKGVLVDRPALAVGDGRTLERGTRVVVADVRGEVLQVEPLED